MPSINMIAARRAEKLKLEKRVRVMCLVTVCELALVLAVFCFMTARIMTTNSSIRKLDGEIKEMQPTVDRIHAYESEIKGLQPKLDLLADSREATLLWAGILQDLSRSMPAKTWLSSLTTARTVGKDDKGQDLPAKVVLDLKGTSLRQQLVGETMLRIGQHSEFDRVDLNYTQRGGNTDWETVEFNLAAAVKQDEPKGGEESKDASN